MAPRSFHQGGVSFRHHVISPLGEDIADEVGGRRLFQVPDLILEQAAPKYRVSTEDWRGSLSSVSSNYSCQTPAASVRSPKKRFGHLLSFFMKGVQIAGSASLNSRQLSKKKVSTTIRRGIRKFVSKFHHRHSDSSMAEYHHASVPEDIGGLLGDLQLPNLVQNRFNNGNVTLVSERSQDKQQVKDKRTSIIVAVEITLCKDFVAKDNGAAIMAAIPHPIDRKAKEYANVPVTPKLTEKNAKFKELSQVRSSKSGNEGYATLRGEKYNSKGPLYDDLAFADAKPTEDPEDVRRSGYNSPELDHNEREFSNTYDHVPASRNQTADDRKPRTMSDMAAQIGYVLINKQLVHPDNFHDTSRAVSGPQAEQWEISQITAQMPDYPTDNNNYHYYYNNNNNNKRKLITGRRHNDDKIDVGGRQKKHDPFLDDNGGSAAGNFDDSTTSASLSQDDMMKSRVAAWEKLTGKKPEPAKKKSVGDSITTGSSNNSPDRPLVSGKVIIEMAKDVKRVETRSTAHVETQTHKTVFEHTREGPKPLSNREDIQDAKHRRKLNKSPGGGSKFSEYSVEIHPSLKDTNEGYDLTCVPQFINKNTGVPLMAPGQSSGIVYDRGRRSSSVRRMNRSESLRSQSRVFERTVMPKSESKFKVAHTDGALQTSAVNDSLALTTARLEKALENSLAELPAVADSAVSEVDLSQDQMLRLVEKVPTEQLVHIFHERLLEESDEREAAMEAQAAAALYEATDPIHGLAYDYEQACRNRVAVAELKELCKTLHHALNGWRREQVIMATHWSANHVSHESGRKNAQDRLKEAKDKLIEVTRTINASDEQYRTMVQSMNKLRRQMMENARRRIGRENFQAFELSLGSPALSVNSLNGGFSLVPQPDTLYQYDTQYNRDAFKFNVNSGQSRSPPGVSPFSHHYDPRLHQLHSSPYAQRTTGRKLPIFLSKSFNNNSNNNNNNIAGPFRRQDTTPQPRKETPRHYPSYAQPNHAPVLSNVPELTLEVATVIQHVKVTFPPTPTPIRQRNSSAPAGPQIEQQQQYRRVVAGVVAGAIVRIVNRHHQRR